MKTLSKKKVRRKPVMVHYAVLDPIGVQWQGGTVPPGELITVGKKFVLLVRWLAAGRIRLEINPTAGICSVCGCTWTRACVGGCSWVSESRTLCSNCTTGGMF